MAIVRSLKKSIAKLLVVSSSLLATGVLVYLVAVLIVLPIRESKTTIVLPETGEADLYYVFVTSNIFTPGISFDDLSSADERCQSAGQHIDADGLWHAWLSTNSVNAKDRVRDIAYSLKRSSDSVVVVQNKADLIDGSIRNTINYDENLDQIESNLFSWTGTNYRGVSTGYNCNNWQGPSGPSPDTETVTKGTVNSLSLPWTDEIVTPATCSGANRLYCFEVLKDRDNDNYYEKVSDPNFAMGNDCDDNDAAVHPGALEVCDGKDNNCDGQVDEGLTEVCGIDTGECQKGIKRCINGSFGECEGSLNPVPEVCDGLDNDCDGLIDDNLTKSCGTNEGICTVGTETCISGNWGQCSGVAPTTEICDGLDNDCDGETDEGCSCDQGQTRVCGTDSGRCSIGTQWCEEGLWGQCNGSVGPSAEICDGLDNDCDGQVDEGLSRSCGSNIGSCTQGQQQCTNGSWGECIGATVPVEEKCDEIDNSCDGTIDENCACSALEQRECGVDSGECKKGYQLCTNGLWGECQNSVSPKEDVCDNLDNDCDGEIDEGYVCEEKAASEAAQTTSSTGPSSGQDLLSKILKTVSNYSAVILGVVISVATFIGMFAIYRITLSKRKKGRVKKFIQKGSTVKEAPRKRSPLD